MKKFVLILASITFLFTGCDNTEESVEAPTNISNVSAEPRVGGALVNWTVPSDSSFTYIEISYLKNGKEVKEKASKYTDTLLVEGLINKEEFSFDLQAVNEIPGAIAKGDLFSTNAVRPIKRSPEITYYRDVLEQINVTADMIDTYTQETSEGPKTNLVDGDPNTYWHSAWSGNTAPLPHWIQINFSEPTDLGAIKYWFRNSGDTNGRPSQWGLEVSDDGQSWERVWESNDGLPISDKSVEHTVAFDKNYTAQYFRVMILKNGSGTWAHLGEISFHKMDAKIVDKELEAEEIYYNF